MKAADILLYLFIFNMFIWIITSGLNIYNFTAEVNPEYQMDDVYTANSLPEVLIQQVSMFNIQWTGMAALVGAVVFGAMIGVFTSGQGAQGAVYGAFTAFFWGSLIKTFGVFYSLTSQVPGTIYVFVIFGAIAGIIFMIGLFQMVTGGWKSFK